MNVLDELAGGALPSVEQPGEEPVENPVEETTVAEQPAEQPAPAAAPAAQRPASDTVPLPVYLDLKHELRDLRQQLRALQTAPSGPAAAPVVEEPDPAQEYAKAHAEDYGGNPDDVPIPAGVLRQRDAWLQRRNERRVLAEAARVREDAILRATHTLTDDVMGEGLGFQTVVDLGYALLTDGDKLDIERAGAECHRALYDRCFTRVLQSGTPQATALRQRYEQRRSQMRVPPKQPQSPAPPKQPEAPTRQELLDPRAQLADFGLDYGEGDD